MKTGGWLLEKGSQFSVMELAVLFLAAGRDLVSATVFGKVETFDGQRDQMFYAVALHLFNLPFYRSSDSGLTQMP